MKVVFILETIDAPRMMKRINEFISHQYEVEVYGFKHFKEKSLTPPSGFTINVIGEIKHANYFLRINGIVSGVRKVLKATKDRDVLYYIPNVEVAMIFRMFSSADYVYEESDLKHTYVSSKLVQGLLENVDKRIIRKSVVSAFTSEGFVKYHYGDNPPQNICYVFNRLNTGILNLPVPEKKAVDINHIKFGFVGKVSFKSIVAFARCIVEKYPQHEMHFYGTSNVKYEKDVEDLSARSNMHLHGRFKNPDDLPNIYKDVNIVIALYDVDSLNVLYAEPNKLYESIYYRTPILVSSGTYLAEKVHRLGIGFDIDATDPAKIDSFISELTEQKINEKINNAEKIDRREAVNDNSILFEHIKEYVSRHHSQKI